jgi:hypothetical protein
MPDGLRRFEMRATSAAFPCGKGARAPLDRARVNIVRGRRARDEHSGHIRLFER